MCHFGCLGCNKSIHKTLQLLNDKSDDEDFDDQAGLKKQNELLQQLLKEDNIIQHGIMLEVIYY